jgi:hypothetical protein
VPVGSIELITKSEYARRRNCTEAAVRRAVNDGRITLIDGKVDPVAADAQWARNTRVRAGSRPADDANLTGAGSSSGGSGAASSGDSPRDDPDAYWAVKARREKAEADMAELKLAELRGELVRRSDIEAVHARSASLFREALLEMATRVAPVIAGCGGDQAKIRQILEEENLQALRNFSGVADGGA